MRGCLISTVVLHCVKIVAPLLRSHEQERAVRRSCDPHVAIVEAVWAAAHTEKEISTDEMAKRVNGLMARRGEILVYNARQIGWKLRTLELHRRSSGKNKVLQFSRDMRRGIDELARQFGLRLPKVAKCKDCEELRLMAEK